MAHGAGENPASPHNARMFQVVSGPVRGHFVAAYACPVGEFGDRFLGYFKVFAGVPHCYVQNGHVAQGTGVRIFSRPLEAIQDVESQARAAIENLDICEVCCAGHFKDLISGADALRCSMPLDSDEKQAFCRRTGHGLRCIVAVSSAL